MQNMIVYMLTFLAVVLPFIYFYGLPNRGGNAPQIQAKLPRRDSAPLLFRFTQAPAGALEYLGFGALCRKLFAGHTAKLDEKLQLCGLKLTVEQVYCSQTVLALEIAAAATGVTAWIVSPDQRASIWVAALIGLLIGAALPGIQIGNLAQERQTKILQSIPYAIDLIASAMRGGLDFGAAVRFYVKLAVPGPLTDEFSQMLREMELGVSRIRALQNMAERVRIKQFSSFVSAIELGTELGSPLTDTMDIQAVEMRKARFALAECKAQRAPSIMLLPMALFIMPAVFIIILTPVFLKMKDAGVPLF